MIEPQVYDSLTRDQRRILRENYVVDQKNKCMYCKEDLNEMPPFEILAKRINWGLFPPNFLKHPIHLQHNHKTGLTEGAVHAFCNAVMWQYEGR